MKKSPPVRIRQKIRHAIRVTAISGILILGLFFSIYMSVSQWRQMQDNIRAHARRTGSGCIFSLSFDDPQAANESLQSLNVLKPFEAGAVYRKDGVLFTQYSPNAYDLPEKIDPAEIRTRRVSLKHLTVSEPVLSGSEVIGYVTIVYSLSGFYLTLLYSLIVMVVGLLMAQWLEFIIGRRFQQMLATPIEELSATVQQVTETGDYSVRADERMQYEIGRLARDFNKMLTEVELRDEMLLLKERRFRAMVDQSVDIILLVRENGQLADCNPLAIKSFHMEHDRLLSLRIEEIIPSFDAEMFSRLWTEAVSGEHPVITTLLQRDEHPAIHAEVKLGILRQEEGELLLVAFCRDITLRMEAAQKLKRTEEHLQHSQKMDSIGQLAGGVAHDFNNMLMGITGAAELLRFNLDEEDLEYLDIILTSAKRASELTKKLLVFSRKKEMEAVPFDVCQCVRDALVLLEHSVDPRIRIITNYDASNPMVSGENSLIQNVILNLGINARDAIVGDGEIHFSVHNTQLSLEDCEKMSFDLIPGEYVHIEVQDTGGGIPEEVQKRIFEPFYTTKDIGKGTGMGLSTAYGTLMEHGGAISVQSRVGEGSTFSILLPAIRYRSEMDAASVMAPLSSGNATILLVDDEQVVRTPVAKFLRRQGYTVREAENGKQGLQLYLENSTEIDLVILDMLMPQMNGADCFREMKKICPEVRAIMISGYTKYATASELEQEGVRMVLRKPFSHKELCLAVENIITA